MALNPNIPLQVQPPPDPLQRMGQIMGLRQQRREGQRQETRFAAEQREQQEQDAVRAVIRKHGGFTEEAIQEIATINPEAALGLQQLIQQGQITALNLKKAQQPEPPPPTPKLQSVIERDLGGRETTRFLPETELPGQAFIREPLPAPDKPPSEPTSFDAEILAAKRSGDPQRLKDAIALKRQAAAAGRGPSTSPQPSYHWATDPTTGQERFMTAEEIRTSGAKPPGTAQSKNRQQARQAVQPVIDAITELMPKINMKKGVSAKIAGGWREALAVANYDDDVAEYVAVVEAFTPLLARAEGHTGVLTEKDFEHSMRILPMPGNSDTLAARKLKRLMQILELEEPAPLTGGPDGWVDLGGGVRVREKR